MSDIIYETNKSIQEATILKSINLKHQSCKVTQGHFLQFIN